MDIQLDSFYLPRGISKLQKGDEARLCAGESCYPVVVTDRFTTLDGLIELQFATTPDELPVFVAVVPIES